MFLVLMLVMAVMVAVVVVLPQVSGVATYTNNPEYQEKKRQRQQEQYEKEEKSRNESSNNNSGYYQEPDQFIDDETEGVTSSTKTSRLRNMRSKLNKLSHVQITDKDIPVKLELAGENELKRRIRGSKPKVISGKDAININPTTYDFDIDEFINEENRKDELEDQMDSQNKYGTYTV